MCTTFSANKRGIRATLPVPSSSAGMTKKFGVMVVTAGSIPAICNWRAAGVKAPRPLTVIIQGDLRSCCGVGSSGDPQATTQAHSSVKTFRWGCWAR
jgi:hypothetical protein